MRDPELPQGLWTRACCEVEVPEALAERSLARLEVGAPVLAGGQLSSRTDTSRGVIVAAIIHPGGPPDDQQSDLFVVGG